MSKQTHDQRITLVETGLNEVRMTLAKQGATLEAIAAHLGINEPAKVTQPKADPKPVTPAKAEPKPKAYRSAKGKEAAKRACEALAVKYDLKVAGGSRTFKSLSAKEQAAYRAEQKAIWAAVPKTRTTKA